MNTSLTHIAVQRQLAAMGCDSYDIGVLQSRGRMLLREGRSARWIEHALGWLRRENARGAQIFVRPHGEHCLTLIDDLDASAILELRHSGFGPSVVVETSVGNFQVWLKHGRVLSRTLSTQAAKGLAQRFGGDLSSADWRHFGRLAGFTNQKFKRRLANGLGPYVRLHQWSRKRYNKAEDFLAEVSAKLDTMVAERELRSQNSLVLASGSISPLSLFHRHPRYQGDLHRADMAWALYAASHGLSCEEIRIEIFHARDLSKKGHRARRLDYASRTATKAVALVRPINP
jgi:RepB DNA-primase from phage plasmid